MQISFYSILMSVLWSSLGVFILYRCLKKKWFIHQFGIQILMALYLLCVLRLLLPVEFQGVKLIGFEGVLAAGYEIIGLKKVEFLGAGVSIISIIAGIWGSGAAFSLVKWMIEYLQGNKRVKKILKYSDKMDEQIIYQTKKEVGISFPIQVWRNPYVDIPMGIGILRKNVILPDDEYSQEQLYYILYHEYTHFKNRDLEIKALLQLFCCIFWWNPCAYLIQRELNQILEIRCDLAVIRGITREEKSTYLHTILQIIQNGLKNKKNPEVIIPSVMMVQQRNQREILERFQIVKETEKEAKKGRSYFGVIVIMFAALCGSYMFQFQAEYWPPHIEGELTTENTYLINNEDGTYTIVDMDGGKLVLPKEHIVIKSMIEQGFEIK